MGGAALAWQAMPERNPGTIARQDFSSFPRNLGQWQQTGPAEILGERVARTLGADD